jgi:hypothetical protein
MSKKRDWKTKAEATGEPEKREGASWFFAGSEPDQEHPA